MATPTNTAQLARCSSCGRLNFISPDPTTCGPCVLDAMAKMRKLYAKQRGLIHDQQRPLAGSGGPLRTAESLARSGDLRHAGSVGPQASPGAEGASSASRIDGRRMADRSNDASTPDVPTVTLAGIDGRRR